MMRKADRVQRNAPVRAAPMTLFHAASVTRVDAATVEVPRVVNEDVDPAIAFHHGLEQRLDGRLLAHVDLLFQNIVTECPQLLGRCRELGHISARKRQPRSFAAEKSGDSLADPLVSARDDDDFIYRAVPCGPF